MGKISQWLKITCRDMSALMSERMDHTLPLSKRLRLGIHLAICGMCKAYQEQLLVLRSLARSVGEEEARPDSAIRLSDGAKEKMKQAIKPSNI